MPKVKDNKLDDVLDSMGAFIEHTVCSTKQFMEMARDAEENKRNRSVHCSKLFPRLDPAGVHLLAVQMLHNDIEWRTMWLVKLKNTMEPVQLWLDVDFDTFKLNTETYSEIKEDACGSILKL